MLKITPECRFNASNAIATGKIPISKNIKSGDQAALDKIGQSSYQVTQSPTSLTPASKSFDNISLLDLQNKLLRRCSDALSCHRDIGSVYALPEREPLLLEYSNYLIVLQIYLLRGSSPNLFSATRSKYACSCILCSSVSGGTRSCRSFSDQRANSRASPRCLVAAKCRFVIPSTTSPRVKSKYVY